LHGHDRELRLTGQEERDEVRRGRSSPWLRPASYAILTMIVSFDRALTFVTKCSATAIEARRGSRWRAD